MRLHKLSLTNNIYKETVKAIYLLKILALVVSFSFLFELDVLASVVITEIMYHPASDSTADEFIEILNTGDTTMDLSGWKFTNGIDFLFPQGTSVGPNKYLVIAADPGRLFKLYDLSQDMVLGPWELSLSNRGERIELRDDGDLVVDTVKFNDGPPWPVEADGEGPSLECINPLLPNETARNWLPSESGLGGGTPGKRNSVSSTVLPPLVAKVTVSPSLPIGLEQAVVTAEIEADGPAEVVVRYDHNGVRELQLYDDGNDPDETASDGIYSAYLPGFPAGSLVRFDVQATENGIVSRLFESGIGIAESRAESNLPVMWIFVKDADWNWLNANLWTDSFVPALLVYEDRIYPNVGIRFRGGRPRLFRKKSLKLEFNHGRFLGRKRVNLNAAAMDDDYMTEPLAYDFYKSVGLTGSETRFVRVQFNGNFWGLFIDVEQVDEDYLQRWNLDPGGVLYKAVGVASNMRKLEGTEYSYNTQYEKKTRKDEPYDDLTGFIHGLYTAGNMEEYLETNLEVESFAHYLAAVNLMAVWDCMQHNYYFYRASTPGARWRIIPWDLDHAWGEWEWHYYYDNTYPLLMGHERYPFAGAWYTWNKLWTVFLDVPRFRNMYFSAIREFLNTEFTEWNIFPEIEQYRQAIESTVLLDEEKWPDNLEPLHTGPRRTMAEELPLLKENISLRRRFVAGLLGVTLLDEPVEKQFRRGDINSDNALNVADAIAMLSYLFSGESLSCLSAADINDDSVCDLADAISLLSYLFADGSKPVEPFETCGADPTQDELGCEEFSSCSSN